MNLKKMRETEFSKKFLTLLSTYHFDSVAPDQDYLNAMCNGKILYLNEEWDAMPAEGKEELKIRNLFITIYSKSLGVMIMFNMKMFFGNMLKNRVL